MSGILRRRSESQRKSVRRHQRWRLKHSQGWTQTRSNPVLEIIVSLTLLLSQAGYTEKDIQCTMSLVQRESNFNLHSRNSTTGAYGLFQIMRINKHLSLKEQVKRFDRYIQHRYQGSPCLALKHFKTKNWYQVLLEDIGVINAYLENIAHTQQYGEYLPICAMLRK